MNKVAIARCLSYNKEDVERGIKEVVKYFGDHGNGLGNYVKNGDRVLIKPNLLLASKPESCVTTHPSLIREIIYQVQDAGGKVTIGDSPGGPNNLSYIKLAYSRAGIQKVALETGAKLNEDLSYEYVSFPNGKAIKKAKICKFVLNADKIITVPKLKTHMFTTFSGACKVQYGYIPGLEKSIYHGKFKEPYSFSELILDIVERFPPNFVFMDGIMGMEGDGPNAGRPKKVGVIIGGEDPISVDIAALSIINIEPNNVPYIANAVKRKLTTGKISDIQILGERIEDVKVLDYKRPGSYKSSPVANAFRVLGRFVTPFISPKPYPLSNCTGCGICEVNCPKKIIRIVSEGNRKRAKVGTFGCIRCYCCHEMCPNKAMGLKKFYQVSTK